MKNILLIILTAIISVASDGLANNSYTRFRNDIKITSFKKTYLKDAKKLAEYYRQRVLRGESMSSIAQLYSEDPGSSQNGGQYKRVVKGMMVPEFEKVAFSLKAGEISEVFETEYGFHFIQLISRKGDVLDLRHVLIMK